VCSSDLPILVGRKHVHYAAVKRDVAAYLEEQREHMLTAHEYGLRKAA
jgi:hypothetical protein